MNSRDADALYGSYPRSNDTPLDPTRVRQPVAADGVRLRICHVAYTFYESDNRVIRYAEALVEAGHEVDVIALRRPGQPATPGAPGVRLYRVQKRSVTERGALSYFFKILAFAVRSAVLLSVLHLRRRYDVIHVHNVPDFLVFTALLPRVTGAKVILDIHDILPELYAGKFGVSQESAVFKSLLVAERLSCAFAHHVIVANHLWQEKLSRRAVAAAKCTTLMNYPDLRIFSPTSSPRADGQPFLILYPGSLNHHQGLDIAIKGFAIARAKMPDAEFHIYGEGPDLECLKRLATDLGLREVVQFKTRLPIASIAAVMAMASVGVVPKRAAGFGDEAFSTKIFEFMACGIPVVVSRTKVDSYYFTDQLVRFFTPEDPASFADALVDVYRTREDHAEWIARARAHALQYAWQERSDDYRRMVISLMASGGVGSSVNS
jgi:glycosyltransferase involved in cell wall biosynthesis